MDCCPQEQGNWHGAVLPIDILFLGMTWCCLLVWWLLVIFLGINHCCLLVWWSMRRPQEQIDTVTCFMRPCIVPRNKMILFSQSVSRSWERIDAVYMFNDLWVLPRDKTLLFTRLVSSYVVPRKKVILFTCLVAVSFLGITQCKFLDFR